jgi:outer membrane lipoprotein-sorting protein
MKKLTIALLIIVALTQAATASPDASFDAVCGEIARRPIVTGDFTLTKTIKRINRTITSSGVFVISAQKGMVWDTREPFPSTLVVGADYIVQIMPDGGHSRLSARGNNTFLRISQVMKAVFTGNSLTLNDNFDVSFTSMNPLDGTWLARLVPKDSAVKTFAAAFILNGKGGVISAITVIQQNGDSMKYQLTNQRYPAALQAKTESLFDTQ